MDLGPYVASLQRQLAVAAAAGGDDARELGERLTAPLDAATRLTLLELLSAAADEISAGLAPGSVDVRLRGGDPELIVVPPALAPLPDPGSVAPPAAATADDSAQARINLRLPEALKARVEDEAGAAGLSVNAWLVRVAAAAVEAPAASVRTGGRPPVADRTRYSGWVA